MRFGIRTGDGDLDEDRYERVEPNGTFPLAPPSHADLENMCGLSCNSRSSGFNACFMSCRRAVENLPALQPTQSRNAQDASLRSHEGTLSVRDTIRRVSANNQEWELNLNQATRAIRASQLNENAGFSDGSLMLALHATSIGEDEARVLLDLNDEAHENGHPYFITILDTAQNSATTVGDGGTTHTCEAPANPAIIGAMTHGEITATQSYPENARYYCVRIPQGVQSITVTLSGMTADLDLYVGANSITSVQGNQAYQWKSNVSGTTDDTVTINQPAAGVYYIEVVSYDGHASQFSILVR